MGLVLFCYFSWEGGGIAINLPRAYEKLSCKGDPHRFCGQRDPLVHIDRHTHSSQNEIAVEKIK